jgi:TP901 family phage tail tape measure protein
LTKIDELYADISIRGVSSAMAQIGAFRTAFGGLKSFVGGGLGAGLAGAIGGGGVVKIGADLEAARLGLKRFVDADFTGLTKGIDKLAGRIPVAVEGLYDIASGAAQVGVKGTQNILNFTEAVANLATISDMSFNETAKNLAKVHNVFNLPASYANRTASTIAGMSAESAADPSELVTLTQYLAPAASLIKFTMEETVALSAALKDAGVSSEVAGTALKSFIFDMGRMPEQFSRALGMSNSEFKKLRDTNPIEVLKRAIKSIQEEPTIDDQMAKAELFGLQGARQAGAFTGLVKVADVFTSHLEKANKFSKDGHEHQRQAAVQTEGLWKQLTLLGNEVKLVADEGFGPLNLLLKDMAAGLRNDLNWLRKPMGDGAGFGNAKWLQQLQGQARGDLDAQGRPRGLPPDELKAQGLRDQEKNHRREVAERLAKQADRADAQALIAQKEVEIHKEIVANLEKESEALAHAAAKAMERAAKDPTEKNHDAVAKAATQKFLADQRLGKASDDLATAKAKAIAEETFAGAVKAKIKALPVDPNAQKDGEVIRQGARKFAFDKMLDPQGFMQFEQAFRALPKEMLDTDAGKEIAKKLAAMGGQDVKKNLTEEELTQLAMKRAGAIGSVAQAVASEKSQRLNARSVFQGADESWKRIQSGAMEGDPMTRILKENTRLHKETTKAVQALQAAVDAGRAEIKDNMIMLVGG